jgi:glycosyltransferase involved in cell wall biosynthesis
VLEKMKPRRAADASRSRPLVSVIIPCHNHANFLGEAIESVLRQTWRPVEILVVDDGSTDHTGEVVARYPSVIGIKQDRRGPAAARNAGLQASRGRYVQFLDADDLLLPAALEIGIAELEEHLEWAFVSGAFRYVDKHGRAISGPVVASSTDGAFATLLRDNYIAMPAMVLFRRNIFERVGGFDVSLPPCEDWDLYLRIAREYPIGQHRQLVAHYRRHDGNTSRNAGLMFTASHRMMARHRPYLGRDPHLRAAYRAGLRLCSAYYDASDFGRNALVQTFNAGTRREGLQCLRFMLRRTPWRLSKLLCLSLCRIAAAPLSYIR